VCAWKFQFIILAGRKKTKWRRINRPAGVARNRPNQSRTRPAKPQGNSFGASGCTQLAEDGGDVKLDGMLRDGKFGGDLLIDEAAGKHFEYFPFAGRERFRELRETGQGGRRRRQSYCDFRRSDDDQPGPCGFERGSQLVRGDFRREDCANPRSKSFRNPLGPGMIAQQEHGRFGGQVRTEESVQ
jgi:hypothetical protein